MSKEKGAPEGRRFPQAGAGGRSPRSLHEENPESQGASAALEGPSRRRGGSSCPPNGNL